VRAVEIVLCAANCVIGSSILFSSSSTFLSTVDILLSNMRAVLFPTVYLAFAYAPKLLRNLRIRVMRNFIIQLSHIVKHKFKKTLI